MEDSDATWQMHVPWKTLPPGFGQKPSSKMGAVCNVQHERSTRLPLMHDIKAHDPILLF